MKTIEIINLQGQKLWGKEQYFGEGPQRIQLPELPNGIYQLLVRHPHGLVDSGPLVINRE